MNLLEYCKKEAMRYAGYPILATEIDDAQFESEIMDPAVYEYYIHAPYEWSQKFDVRGKGETTVKVPDLASVYSGSWPSEVEAEHIGLTGFFFNQGPPAALGIVGQTGGNVVDQLANIEHSRIQATVMDQTLGDATYRYDPIAKSYKVFVSANGTVSLTFGYRLNTWQYIPYSHATIFAKISTKKYLELLISGRSSVVISSDVTLDTTALQQKLDLINETYEEDISTIVTPFMVWA